MPLENNSHNAWGDKEILEDATLTQKAMANLYSVHASESFTLNIRTEWLDLMREEEEILYELYVEMQKRNWFPLKMADQAQIMGMQQQFQAQKP